MGGHLEDQFPLGGTQSKLLVYHQQDRRKSLKPSNSGSQLSNNHGSGQRSPQATSCLPNPSSSSASRMGGSPANSGLKASESLLHGVEVQWSGCLAKLLSQPGVNGGSPPKVRGRGFGQVKTQLINPGGSGFPPRSQLPWKKLPPWDTTIDIHQPEVYLSWAPIAQLVPPSPICKADGFCHGRKIIATPVTLSVGQVQAVQLRTSPSKHGRQTLNPAGMWPHDPPVHLGCLFFWGPGLAILLPSHKQTPVPQRPTQHHVKNFRRRSAAVYGKGTVQLPHLSWPQLQGHKTCPSESRLDSTSPSRRAQMPKVRLRVFVPRYCERRARARQGPGHPLRTWSVALNENASTQSLKANCDCKNVLKLDPMLAASERLAMDDPQPKLLGKWRAF